MDYSFEGIFSDQLSVDEKSGYYKLSNDSFSNIYIAKTICKILNKDPKKNIKFVKDRLYNDRRYSVSTDKIRRLGWKPKDNLMTDLPEIINWYQNNIQLFKKFKL